MHNSTQHQGDGSMRILRVSRRLTLWLGVLMVGALWALWSCSGSTPCQNDTRNAAANTEGLPCQSRCDCNNQAYEGYCKDGKCFAFPRQSCTQVGAAVPLQDPPQADPSPACEWGERICKPPSLQALLWGDCKAFSPVAEEGKEEDPQTAKQQCTNNRDDDCDGKIDDGDDGCTAYCKVIGAERPCYDGAPQDTLNLGTCAAGLQRCQPDLTWSKCAQTKPPPKRSLRSSRQQLQRTDRRRRPQLPRSAAKKERHCLVIPKHVAANATQAETSVARGLSDGQTNLYQRSLG